MTLPKRLEILLETGLFNARWLMAPFYVGLVLGLAALLVVFVAEIVHAVPHLLGMTTQDAIMLVLSLIDLSLAGNLVLIVIFSGYENFVSKFDVATNDRPNWMGKVDFSGMKMKLIASIVAISAIALLQTFMKIGEDQDVDRIKLLRMVTIHITFVVSGVLMAVMDWVAAKSHAQQAATSQEGPPA